jgi:hypothetical protein
MTIRGWVYVITNEAMPGLVKIGYSTKDPALRAAELSHTGSPHPYSVAYDVLVNEPRTIETIAHAALAEKREGKEWFRCSIEIAVKTIRQVVGEGLLIENIRHISDSISTENETAHISMEAVKCMHYGCIHTAARSYKGSLFCDEHYRKIRLQSRSYAENRIRDELKEEWAQRNKRP